MKALDLPRTLQNAFWFVVLVLASVSTAYAWSESPPERDNDVRFVLGVLFMFLPLFFPVALYLLVRRGWKLLNIVLFYLVGGVLFLEVNKLFGDPLGLFNADPYTISSTGIVLQLLEGRPGAVISVATMLLAGLLFAWERANKRRVPRGSTYCAILCITICFARAWLSIFFGNSYGD